MDREGAARIPVTNLDHHASADRVGEGFAFAGANKETFAFDLHVSAPFPGILVRCQFEDKSSGSSPEIQNPQFSRTLMEAAL